MVFVFVFFAGNLGFLKAQICFKAPFVNGLTGANSTRVQNVGISLPKRRERLPTLKVFLELARVLTLTSIVPVRT